MSGRDENKHDDSGRLSEDDLMALFAEDDDSDSIAPGKPAKAASATVGDEQTAQSPAVSMEDEINELTSFLDDFAEELQGASDDGKSADAGGIPDLDDTGAFSLDNDLDAAIIDDLVVDMPDEELAAKVPSGASDDRKPAGAVAIPDLDDTGAFSLDDDLDAAIIDDLVVDMPDDGLAAKVPSGASDDRETAGAVDIPELDDTGPFSLDDGLDSAMIDDLAIDIPEEAPVAPSTDVSLAEDAADEVVEEIPVAETAHKQSELFIGDEAADEVDDQAEGAQDDQNNESLEGQLAAVAAATAAKPVVGREDVAVSLRKAKQQEMEADKPMNRILVMGMGALALLGVVIGGAAFVKIAGVQGQVANLNQQLDTLNLRIAKLGGASGPADNTRIADLADEVKQVNKRIGEMALIIEGPLSHATDGREELDQRIAALEESMKSMAGKLDAQKQAVAAKPQSVASTSTGKTVSKPAPTKSGDWIVAVVSLSNKASAEFEQRRMSGKGIPAELRVAESGGKTWYRIVVPGFASRDEAEAFARELESKHGIKDAWPTKE